MPLLLTAPAKINLTLRVLGRQADGYHRLDSFVAFADIGDRLTLAAASATALHTTGPFADALDTEAGSNLVLQALDILERTSGRPLPTQMTLQKNLPVAAGLGGGSADAAAALRGLNALYRLGFSADDLAALAASLGADVPVCLASAPAQMRGIGHELTRLPDLPALDVVLVNPRRALPTGPVFQALQSDVCPDEALLSSMPPSFADAAAVLAYCADIGNDLQGPASGLVSEIDACIDALQRCGASHAAMSGSGATCFGLVPAGQGAALADAYLRARPQDWTAAGRLIGAGDTEIDEFQEN